MRVRAKKTKNFEKPKAIYLKISMALEYNTDKSKKRIPIGRNSRFFGADDFNMEIGIAKEYIEHDANQTVILYRVDLSKTKVNDIYNEASKDGIRFLPPVEIPVVYEVSDSEMKTYDSKKQKGIYSQGGRLTFSVLISTLEEYGCDISRGDYIGVQIDHLHRIYYTVTDDGRVASTANRFSMYGTVPFARKIECSIVDISEFEG